VRRRRAGGVRAKVLEHLQLISPGIHVDKINNNDPGNVAQSQLASNF
jgi:hypothetical protein